MFKTLQKINKKPKPYQYYTAELLWNDSHISKKMLEMHLKEDIALASRTKDFINKSVEWIISKFSIGNKSKICDFGCGPGLYTTLFAEKGAQVTGIDFSERSINYAKNVAQQKKLNIDYVLTNYLQFSTDKRFDLIIMIYCDFCALSSKQREILLKKFHTFLKDDGILLLDVFSTNRFNSTEEKMLYDKSSDKDFWSNFWSDKPYYVFTNTFKYEKEKLLLDKYTIFEENRTSEVFNWLQCYSIQSLKEEFKKNYFNIVEYHSDVSGNTYSDDSMEIAITAKKA